MVVAMLQIEVVEVASGQESHAGGEVIVRYVVGVRYLHSLLGK